MWIDLLKAEEFRRYVHRPELLRLELADGKIPKQVVIDEIQKVPQLLDEVHWLHENRGLQFAPCGSSARKVRRGHANLFGGRALRNPKLSGRALLIHCRPAASVIVIDDRELPATRNFRPMMSVVP